MPTLSKSALSLFQKVSSCSVAGEFELEFVPFLEEFDDDLSDLMKALSELSSRRLISCSMSLEVARIELTVAGRRLEKEMNKVFVVHGHDDELVLEVENFLRKIELDPVIIAKKPSGGKTIIEMIEHRGDVQFAIVLLTPDDKGGLNAPKSKLRPRARQNVILELGYFVGRLGRDRVISLYRGDVELPSDMHGVIYIPTDMPNNDWRIDFAKNLKLAKIPFNQDNVLDV